MTKQQVEEIVKQLKERFDINEEITVKPVRERGKDWFKLTYDDFYSYMFYVTDNAVEEISYFFQKVVGIIISNSIGDENDKEN